MVDVRQKGLRGEYAVRDLLRTYTKHGWERVPTSGASEHTKGDIYIPQEAQKFLIEVKNYKDSPIEPNLLSAKTNNLRTWWNKISAQAAGHKIRPMLFFKHDRGRWYVGVEDRPTKLKNYIYIGALKCYVMLAEEFLQDEWGAFTGEIEEVTPTKNAMFNIPDKK